MYEIMNTYAKKIIVGGASTAYGMYDLERGGWVNRLKLDTLAYTQHHPLNPMSVLNLAEVGSSLDRTAKTVLEQRTYSHEDTALVISAGINEAKIPRGRIRPYMDLERFGTILLNFCEIGLELRGVSALMLVGPQRVDEARNSPNRLGTYLEDDLVAEYSQIMQDTAQETGATFVDCRSLFDRRTTDPEHFTDLLAVDGYHPNDVMHEIMKAEVKLGLANAGFWPADNQ